MTAAFHTAHERIPPTREHTVFTIGPDRSVVELLGNDGEWVIRSLLRHTL